MDASSKWNPRTVAAFASITLIWGATWIVTRGQLGDVPVEWSIAYRCLIAAAAVLGAAAIVRQPVRLARNHHFAALCFGILQFVLNLGGVYAAERFIPSGLVAIIFATLVIPNAMLSWLVLGQPLGVEFRVGSAITLTGVALLIFNEARSSELVSGELVKGVSLTVAAMLSASAANILNATGAVRRAPLLPMLGWALVYSSIISFAVALARDGPPQFSSEPMYWLGLLYLGIGATAVAFVLYYSVLRSIGPARAAYANVLFPILAMLLSTWFEHYRWTAISAAGAGAALIGLIIALRARVPKHRASAPDPALSRALRREVIEQAVPAGECSAG